MLPIVISSGIFIAALILIFTEKMNRTIVGLFGAMLMVTFGLALGFYSEQQAIATLDMRTLGLLLGMMILVALLEPTGFFEFIAVWVGKLSAGRPFRLMILLGAVTSVLSMFLDNVTTVVLIAPVTILICEILGYTTAPYLIAEAMLSNIGGVSTLVGDPPNVLIGSAAGLSFADFLRYSFPLVIVVWLFALASLLFIFRKELSEQVGTNTDALKELDPWKALRDRKTALSLVVIVLFAVVLFLLEDFFHISPLFVAMFCAALALVWVKPDIKATLNRVEWDILLFFASLFVMVGGLEAAGALEIISNLIVSLSDIPVVWLGVIVLWLVAFLSAIVDNIPITIALIPVIISLGESGIDVQPLWWALAFGAGFGGNGTIIGSTANVVVTTLSEKTRSPITAIKWNRTGTPVSLISLVAATTVYILISFTAGWG